MKKIILFAVFAVFAFTTQAQVKFGPKAGLNLSTWTGNVGDLNMKPGFYVGGLANVKVAYQFSLQPELLVSAEGTNGKNISYNTMYINIPVMAQYNTPSGFYVEAGPQLGLLLSAKVKLDGESIDVKESTNTTNFGASFGAGYNMGLGFGLGFGARYNLGLSNAYGDKVNTSNISIGLHYNFGGSKFSND
jgi:hypothetical protein